MKQQEDSESAVSLSATVRRPGDSLFQTHVLHLSNHV